MENLKKNKKSTDEIIKETFLYLRKKMPTDKAIKIGSYIEKEISFRLSVAKKDKNKIIF
jgi:hypothetical protein